MTRRIVPWDVLRIHRPLAGVYTMLELGMCRGLGGKTYNEFFNDEGIDCTSMRPAAVLNGGHHSNGSEHPFRRYDMVSNVYASEYVDGHDYSQEAVWAMILGSAARVIVSITALPNSPGGGYYRPAEEFYRQLASLNRWSIDRMYETTNRRGLVLCVRLTRQGEVPFRMPEPETIRKPGYPRTRAVTGAEASVR